MKTLATLALSLCLCLSLAGCAAPTSTPGSTTQPAVTSQEVQALTAANSLFGSSVQALNQLRAVGMFTETEWQTMVLPGINGLSNALDAWQLNPGSQAASAAFNAALPQILQYIQLGTARKPAGPTTVPTTRPAQ